MRNIAAKYLVWILTLWIGSGCMMLPTADAAECQTTSLTNAYYRAADQVASAATPNRRGNGDESIILDEPDAVDSDAAAPTAFEDSQAFSLAGETMHQCIAVDECAHPWLTTTYVEPRFLRYVRLLN